MSDQMFCGVISPRGFTCCLSPGHRAEHCAGKNGHIIEEWGDGEPFELREATPGDLADMARDEWKCEEGERLHELLTLHEQAESLLKNMEDHITQNNEKFCVPFESATIGMEGVVENIKEEIKYINGGKMPTVAKTDAF